MFVLFCLMSRRAPRSPRSVTPFPYTTLCGPCASCAGPLFGGQGVVVAGGYRWTRREALELSAIAARVTIVGDIADGPERLAAQERLTIVPGRITALRGSNGLETVAVTHRSEERRVGKECVSTCRSRWSPYP